MSTLPRSEHAFGFTSPRPRVRLVHAFERPFENVVATARTCYSARGIVTEDQASAKPERRDALAKSIYAAGHHTTFQHAHFQFALENVSRQFLWIFLHRKTAATRSPARTGSARAETSCDAPPRRWTSPARPAARAWPKPGPP